MVIKDNKSKSKLSIAENENNTVQEDKAPNIDAAKSLIPLAFK